MKSQIQPPKRCYRYDEWEPWYAWYPVRAETEEFTKHYYNPWRWVWLEIVEWRYEAGFMGGHNRYRTIGANVT